MERINRGDIWTVELISHPKPRPALIVSINAINDLRPNVLVIPITSQPAPCGYHCLTILSTPAYAP